MFISMELFLIGFLVGYLAIGLVLGLALAEGRDDIEWLDLAGFTPVWPLMLLSRRWQGQILDQ